MARNGTGGYILPSGNPVVSGTTITDVWANTTLPDIGNEITNSLPRDGQAPMTAALKIIDGAVSAPSLTFNSESSTGFYRPSSGQLGITLSTVQAALFSSTGLSLPGLGKALSADFSNATLTNRFNFTTSTVNGDTTIPVTPNGTSTNAGVAVFNNSVETNAAYTGIQTSSTACNLIAGVTGTGTALPLAFSTNGSQWMQISTTGVITVSGTASFNITGNAATATTASSATTVTGSIASAVTATTQSANDNSTKVATTAYADKAGGFTGEVRQGFFATAPTGWLLVPNAVTNISRTTYAALNTLMSAAGYPFGSGDGSTTFGMPYIPAGYTWAQVVTTLGAISHGKVKDHTHNTAYTVYNNSGNTGLGAGASSVTMSVIGTTNPLSPEGGADNLAASVGINYIIKT